MNAEMVLRALAAGELVPSGAVLQPAKLSAFGRESYGEEEIVELFRRHPLGSDGRWLACADHAALLWGDRALFADLSNGHVMRLWRMGPGEPIEREPGISVPFDPDLAQARGDVILQASDHPALAAADVARVAAAGSDLARSWMSDPETPAMRARAFCIRAFSAENAVVVLFAVYRLTGNRERTVGFVHTVAVIEDSVTVVRDEVGETAVRQAGWRPRVA